MCVNLFNTATVQLYCCDFVSMLCTHVVPVPSDLVFGIQKTSKKKQRRGSNFIATVCVHTCVHTAFFFLPIFFHSFLLLVVQMFSENNANR